MRGKLSCFVVFLSLVLLTGFVLGGFAAEEEYKIGLVFDVGGKGDKSFNDSAARGLEWAKDGSEEFGKFETLPVSVTTIEPGSGGAGREDAMRMMAIQGFDLVIGVGFLFSDSAVALAEEFPSVSFAVVDFAPPQDKEIPSNLRGLSFAEQQGSFLVGAAAAMKTKRGTVGFIGGMSSPLIKKFEAGFRSGVWFIDPEIEVLSNYVGTTGAAFANPSKGKELAKAQFDKGADVIYHAAGLSGAGVIAAAAERGRYAIGVDSDQNYLEPGHVLTSMLKRVDVAVYKTVRDVVNGEFTGGKNLHYGLEGNGVDYARDLFNQVEEFPEQVQRLKETGKVSLPGLGQIQLPPKKVDELPEGNLLTEGMVKELENLKGKIIGDEITIPTTPKNVSPKEPVK